VIVSWFWALVVDLESMVWGCSVYSKFRGQAHVGLEMDFLALYTSMAFH
jgi:hypothetical protein